MTKQFILGNTGSTVDASGIFSRAGVLRLVLVLAFLAPLLSGTAAMAQTGTSSSTAVNLASFPVGDKKYDAKEELMRLSKLYKLKAVQKSSIEPILVDQQIQVYQLGENVSLTDSEWIEAVRVVHQETVLKVRAQMADTQEIKYARDEEQQDRDAEEEEQTLYGQSFPGEGPPGQ